MFAELLRGHAQHLPDLSEPQIGQLEAHFSLLLRWNRVMNLSAVRNEAEIVERHFCESLFLAGRLPEGRFRIVDIGSGAGFPGIPVAVLRPDCEVVLVESHQRKSVFLRESTRELDNVEVISKRVESVEMSFGWAISRAVALPEIWDWVVGHAPSGAFLTGVSQTTRLPEVEWNPPIPLPWGDSRVLRTFDVSRETI